MHSVTGTAIHVAARLRPVVVVGPEKSNTQMKWEKNICLDVQQKHSHNMNMLRNQLVIYTQFKARLAKGK